MAGFMQQVVISPTAMDMARGIDRPTCDGGKMYVPHAKAMMYPTIGVWSGELVWKCPYSKCTRRVYEKDRS